MQLRYENVCLESLGYDLPTEIVSTEELEHRLAPLYERLRLPTGRLELMTGIRERRFFPADMPPSAASIRSARRALEAAGLEPSRVGALIHGSVCRDFLEPATACGVHRELGLPNECVIYDVSNACLGILNGILQAADLIELGRIEAALVVGTENGRHLVENTVESLNAATSLTREDIKLSIASLTIGAASAAVLLTHRSISKTQNRLLGGAVWADTAHHELCRSGRDEARADGVRPLMSTDSEALLQGGVSAASAAYGRFLETLGWNRDYLQKTVCHQVGVAHKKLIFQSLGLEPAMDFSTFEFLGNTGSAALPITAALGAERGHLQPGDRTALLGIGSGINVVMLGVQWQPTPVRGGTSAGDQAGESAESLQSAASETSEPQAAHVQRVGPLVSPRAGAKNRV
ncbi:MAG: 3-oxoacyl-ACP synthase III [Pirellulales bacterium]